MNEETESVASIRGDHKTHSFDLDTTDDGILHPRSISVWLSRTSSDPEDPIHRTAEVIIHTPICEFRFGNFSAPMLKALGKELVA